MSLSQVQQILREILELLDQLVGAILGRNWNDLTQNEKDEYQKRKSRILVLQKALKDLQELQ